VGIGFVGWFTDCPAVKPANGIRREYQMVLSNDSGRHGRRFQPCNVLHVRSSVGEPVIAWFRDVGWEDFEFIPGTRE
jgi:hypothetical protein